MRALVLALVLAGCGDARRAGQQADDAGARLEAAAGAAGLLPDLSGGLAGMFARGPDRMCVSESGKVGVLVDYGEDDVCAGSGRLRRTGGTLQFDLGPCRIDAVLDGEQVRFPGRVDEACAALCRGDAGLAGTMVDRVGASAAEARTFRLPDGSTPCVD